ncbi:MAG: FRG domain-containing protein, partial [Desulfosalsimonadaceae bacterium]|nr:FRG domain-containing protein [Desulfosalsimonadaceae bacterium]
MARPKRWESEGVTHGVWTVKLSSWKYFHDYVTQEMLDYAHYVWRGDRCDNRPLLPSFDRTHLGKSQSIIERRLKGHLEIFKEATRGRRGANPSNLAADNDWWALGQHHGLDTPLLDWTHSAFVALFFAF